MSRLGSSAMWLMPVGSGRGVLACGVNDKIGQDRNLIRAFRYLVSAEMSRQQEDQVPMIETELVMKQVNEVTHEVNNPLSIIQNYLHTLSLKLEENSPVQTDIETIKHELIRVSGIVEKYAQIGRRQDLLTREVDVNELIKPLAEVIRGGHENIEVEFNFDEAIPLLTITPDSLKQVIVNLIKNSAEALKDTSDATISISTHGSINLGGARYLEINVCDNGPGIPLSIRNEIFQRGTSNKEGEHSGLGLSIVNQLVADMGGMISCRSQVQSEGIAGTNFQILIPLVAEPAHPEIQD